MKTFLFFSDEGFCYDPNNKEIPNMQILGHGEGIDINDAFSHFKANQSYLEEYAFVNVIALEYVGDFIRHFEV